MATNWGRLARDVLGAALRAGAASASRTGSRRPSRRPAPAPRHDPARAAADHPGDFRWTARVEYSPDPDGDADPGEVVRGWVPYEDDPRRGKDRPALVVGRDGRWVLALMLTSKDHVGGSRTSSEGRDWMDVGTGAWDAQRRPSEVRLDRVLRLDPDGIRREGAVLDRRRFDAVAARLRDGYGWT